MSTGSVARALWPSDWDLVFAKHPEPVTIGEQILDTTELVSYVRTLARRLTRPQRKALPILLYGALTFAPSEIPANERGYVRQDVLRRLMLLDLAVELPADLRQSNPIYAYGSSSLTYAVALSLRKKKRRRRRVMRGVSKDADA